MTNKLYIISIILFIGCFSNVQLTNNSIQTKFSFDIITYDIDKVDLVESKVLLNVPLNILVFEKINEQFESNIEISLKIEDTKTNFQLDRIIWNEKVISQFYNNTRNEANYHSIIKNINILPGEYKFIITITDSRNSLKWKLDEHVVIEKNHNISDLFPFYYHDEQIYFIDKDVPLDIDTIYFDIQFPAKFKIDSVKQSFSYKDSIIFCNSPFLTKTKNHSVYRTALSVNNYWQGEYLYTITSISDTSSSRLYFNSSNKDSLWSDDIYELVGVMSYILKYSDIKKINNMPDEEKLKFIREYWQMDNMYKDEKSHQLLLELSKRFNFANKEFTIKSVVKGWESDRGKQYIIRGAPEKIEDKYSYERNINYQVWSYASGEKIIFIEVAMGDFRLQN